MLTEKDLLCSVSPGKFAFTTTKKVTLYKPVKCRMREINTTPRGEGTYAL